MGLIEQREVLVGGQSVSNYILVDDSSKLLAQFNDSSETRVVDLIGLNILAKLSTKFEVYVK